VENQTMDDDAYIERHNCADGGSRSAQGWSAKMAENEYIVQESVEAGHEKDHCHVYARFFDSCPVTAERVLHTYGDNAEIESPEEGDADPGYIGIGRDEREEEGA